MLKKRNKIKVFVAAVSLIAAVFSLFSLLIYNVTSDRYRGDDELFNFAKENSATVYYAIDPTGVSYEIWTDRSGGGEEWSSLHDIPDTLRLGFIAAEDRSFYSHKGVNIKRTGYALINQLLHIKPSFGASTITQQVIKNISGDNERSFERKATEILRAVRLENNHSKDEILELYLNIVPMSRGIYGVGAASRLYFGKEPSELTVAESATLIGVTNAPGLYDPISHPDASQKKRDRVLYAMLECGVISEEEYQQAKSEPLVITGVPKGEYNISSWFIETAKEDILNDLTAEYGVNKGAAKVMLKGASVTLTVDGRVQKILEEYFENENNLPEAFSRGLNYSFAITDNISGDLIGIIGSAGEKSGNNLLNFATLPVPPASTLKPLALYSPLLDLGIDADAIFDDVPLYYKERDGKITAFPKNSPDAYDGDITLSDAIAYSKNTVAMQIYDYLGRDFIFDKLKGDYGFDTLVLADKNPSPLALGQLTSGIPLRKLTEAYGAFTDRGMTRNARTYISVFSGSGELLLENVKKEKRVMKIETAANMIDMLRGVVDKGTAKGIGLKEIVDTAGKTGTSGGDFDRLFIGFTPYYTAGIWCGYTSSKVPIGSNSPSHLNIWDEVMKRIHEEVAFSRDEVVLNF